MFRGHKRWREPIQMIFASEVAGASRKARNATTSATSDGVSMRPGNESDFSLTLCHARQSSLRAR